jgi:hypothetical protein
LKYSARPELVEGQPVGSRALQQYSGLDASPATIRNVMADLEDIGLVSSPHTSAGRIPTGLAYRLFIDTMLVTKPLDSSYVQQSSIEKPALQRHTAQASLVWLRRWPGVTPKTSSMALGSCPADMPGEAPSASVPASRHCCRPILRILPPSLSDQSQPRAAAGKPEYREGRISDCEHIGSQDEKFAKRNECKVHNTVMANASAVIFLRLWVALL